MRAELRAPEVEPGRMEGTLPRAGATLGGGGVGGRAGLGGELVRLEGGGVGRGEERRSSFTSL